MINEVFLTSRDKQYRKNQFQIRRDCDSNESSELEGENIIAAPG